MAGGTASGKTTLSRRLVERFQATLIGHDRYYLDAGQDPSTFNFDHPGSLDTPALVAHLDLLKEGESADLPCYDFRTHTRLPEVERVAAAPVVVVEGILVLATEALRQRADLSVYVHADDDLRLCRRIARDMAERGRTAQSVLAQYQQTVRPMHRAYVAPSRWSADLVVDGEGAIEDALDAVVEAVVTAGGPQPS